MSNISLFLDQDNELRFNVAIEGSKPGTPKYRLVLEGKNLSYAFNGSQTAAGEVSFIIPSMKNVIKEQNLHANLEVMIDDRYFTPLSFNALFEESVKVVAESISRPVQKKIDVSASIVSSNRQTLPSRPSSNTHQVISENSKTKNAAEVIGVMDGRQITAEDLRRILRSGGKL
jgi:hypothetical protein